MNPIRLAIVEDNPDYRDTFSDFIRLSDNCVLCGVFASGEEAIKSMLPVAPDVIFMDVELPGMNGIECIAQIKKVLPKVPIIVLSVYEDSDFVFDALCVGAIGYLTKEISQEKLRYSIQEAVNGGAPMTANIARMVVNSFHRNIDSPLSSRETEVISLLVEGRSYQSIANQLYVSKETIKSHIKNIYIKLHVNNKEEAIKKARSERLI